MVRAVLWLVGMGGVGGVAIALFSNLDVTIGRLSEPLLLAELIGILGTAIGAVIAAFYLSVPGRSSRWGLVPIPFFVLWMASSGDNCYQDWLVHGTDGWALGESFACFRFILMTGVPIALSLLLILRRAHPLAPIRVAAIAGLGVAAMAAFLLQFFHTFDITFLDLAVHLAAGAMVAAGSALVGLSRRRGGFMPPARPM